MYLRLFLTSIGIFLCLGSSAQVLPLQKGSIVLKSGEKLNGYLTPVNSQKIVFKTDIETKDKTYYKAKSVKRFTYGKEMFQAINYKTSTFFVRMITRGQISLYKRDFAPNRNKAYFIKSKEGFSQITKANYFDDLKDNMKNTTFLKKFDEESFKMVYGYNQSDLNSLVSNYNLERPESLIAYDFMEESDTSKNDILGFATEQNFGNFSLSGGDSNRNVTKIPNTVRNDLVLKSEVIYGQILDALTANNWKKVTVALKLLQPLGAELEAFNNKNSYDELVKYAKLKQKDNFKKTFVLFVSDGVQALMKSASMQSKSNMRKVVVRQAFVEFLEIKEELKKTDAALANKIMSQFKVTFASAEDSSKFTAQTANITASFQKVAAKM